MNDRVIAGHGTAESDWLAWLPSQDTARITADEIFANNSRVVVVAPHPDDEILACGGLLALCARRQFPVLVVAVTDGEASHGAVDKFARARLCQQRVHERCAGLIQLGIDPRSVVRLKVPDGQASLHGEMIFDRLAGLLKPRDVVVTTWVLDGHPDHEATAQAVLRTGCQLFQVPVWMWHWAQPGEGRIPWAELVVLELDDQAMDAKQKALSQHHSQLAHRSTATGPVLATEIIQRAARRQEYFFKQTTVAH